jgi:hypothetical protein
MRKKFDYWGVPFSELFPNYHAPTYCRMRLWRKSEMYQKLLFVSMSNMREKIYLVLWRLYFN